MMMYNTPIELGIRAGIILKYIYPNNASINKIAYLDYISIYSKKFTGMESLHPEVPMYHLEFSLRFDTLKSGLMLMINKGVITAEIFENKIYYSRGENIYSFLNLIDNEYHTNFSLSSEMVSKKFGDLKESQLYNLIISSEF